MSAQLTVYIIGHSNKPAERLLTALQEAQVGLLVDVRQLPASRRNPQFNQKALAGSLAEHDIVYKHLPSLGGRRPVALDSPNSAVPEGVRGFADYMASGEFEHALTELMDDAGRCRAAIMCAEALPAHCHRSLISDALVARDVRVVHLLAPGEQVHTLSPLARVVEGIVQYPAMI